MTAAILAIALTRLPHGAGLPLPAPQTAQAAGADLLAALGADEEIELAPGARWLVPCGFAMALPSEFSVSVPPSSFLQKLLALLAASPVALALIIG